MKATITFTAEITENIPDYAKKDGKVLSEEQNKQILEDALRELCLSDAEIIVRDFKLTERD